MCEKRWKYDASIFLFERIDIFTMFIELSYKLIRQNGYNSLIFRAVGDN